MKKIVYCLIALVMLLSCVVTGCGKRPGSAGEVNVYNWGGPYIDDSIFSVFERETGIRVNYSEYQSNEDMYSLMRMGGTNMDLVVPSDYMVARLIDEGMLEQLDFRNIPNFKLIDDAYKGLEYDPLDKYSVAYMTGTVGLIYNSAMITDKIVDWSALFDPRYTGQILMFNNPRDAFGIALSHLGYSQNTINETEIREAYDLLVKQRPLLQAYVMDQILNKLEAGEAAIGPYYAGDYLIMRENNEDLAFVRPNDGSNMFVDAMCIPKGAENKKNAELFINFMCRTDISLKNMEETQYASANAEAAKKFGADMDPEDYEIMFASDETLANCEVFIHLPNEILALYDQLWVELKK